MEVLQTMDNFDLMLLGLGLGGFMFYVVLPLIFWIFNLGEKPRQIMPHDYVKELQDTREWMENISKMSDNVAKDFFKDYVIPDNNDKH